jgi:hypothetical protein
LPDDSEFCQYCGAKVVDNKEIDKMLGNNDENPSSAIEACVTPKNNSKKIKKTIFIASIIFIIICSIVVSIIIYNNYFKNDPLNTPEQTYKLIYDWLVENGDLLNGETLVYSELNNFNKTYEVWTYRYNDKVLFAELLIDNYLVDGKPCKLSVSLELLPDQDGIARMIVSLDSLTSRAYCTKNYYIDVDTFRKNVPIESGDVQCSSNTPAFNFTYTPEEKADSLNYLDDINDNSYEYLIDLLEWVANDFAPKVSLTIQDFGYIKYD